MRLELIHIAAVDFESTVSTIPPRRQTTEKTLTQVKKNVNSFDLQNLKKLRFFWAFQLFFQTTTFHVKALFVCFAHRKTFAW